MTRLITFSLLIIALAIPALCPGGGDTDDGVAMNMNVRNDSFRPLWEDDLPVPEGAERIFISLRSLAGRVQKQMSENNAPDNSCRYLSGLAYPEGYIVDSDQNDIILFGLTYPNRPPLRLDDLVVNMRQMASGGQHPYCSLEPRKQDSIALQKLMHSKKPLNSSQVMKDYFKKVEKTVGPQKVVVGGVPGNSRHAHVMIDADYHMKKVSQGHIAIDGVTSYLDQSLNDAAQKIKRGERVPSGVSMARFWFHVDDNSPTFQQAEDIVLLDDCRMILLTEKQKMTASGDLVDVMEDDPHAEAFASAMSEYLSNPRKEKPSIYADLENLFRLRALLISMRYMKAFQYVRLSPADYIPQYRYQDESRMEASLPGLANYREWSHRVSRGNSVYTYTLFPMVCGGVSMDMTVTRKDYQNQRSFLIPFRNAALKSRPKGSFSWKIF